MSKSPSRKVRKPPAPPPEPPAAADDRPAYGRGRPPGAKNMEATPFVAKIYAAVTPEQKERLELIAVQRRHKERRPPRWGVSDLVRELIESYLQTTPE